MRLPLILALSLFVLSPPGVAQDRTKSLWRASVAFLAGATAADVQSSWGKRELNPLLQNGNGRFGLRGLAVKSGITGGAILAQWLFLRNHGRAAHSASFGNLVMGGVLAGIAVRNHTISGAPAVISRPAPAVPLR